ncbi:alanine racemase [bacterium]|nr:alanine racemase [bacterium]
MTNTRPTRAEVSLSALRHNFAVARHLAGSAKVMAVVKAEAYGHGLIRVSQEFTDCGADYLGVSFLEEGVVLREAGIELPILVMGGLVDEQIKRYLDYNLEITISSIWKAVHADEIASKQGVKANIHIKIDTGMGRIGQQYHSAEKLFSAISKLKHLEIKGLYTHLASAHAEDTSFAETQLDRFDEVVGLASKLAINPPYIHAANSGALMQLPERSTYNMVRPGLMLYGYPPNQHLIGKLDLQPAMTLKTRVVYVKYPPAGTPLGYDSTWKSPGNRWIATLPIGYGDGYPRRLGNCGSVILRGRRCPVVGIVSMDQITIDAGNEAYLGDEIILFGSADEHELPLWELCRAIDAIPYELLCGLTARVPRVYIYS